MNIETADRLLKYRKKFGFSQEELAEKIGVSRQAISKWERGEASPDTENLILLAKIYEITIDELLLGTVEPENKFGAGSPDENVTYVKKDKVSFKNGIHVHSKDGDKVDIGFSGIHVDSSNGDRVHVDGRGVFVEESGTTRAYTDENGDVYVDEELDCHKSKIHPSVHFVISVASLALFLAWGFSGVMHGWALSWTAILLIPVLCSLLSAIEKKKPDEFAYPVLCVIIYMFIGFLDIWFLGGWTWGWVVFLTIPLYYWLVEFLTKLN